MTVELSGREREVAELIADGWSHRRIARHLGISRKTVEFHAYRAAAKLPGDRRSKPSFRIVAYFQSRTASEHS